MNSPPDVAAASGHVPEIGELDLTSHGILQHFAKSTQNVRLLNFLMALDRVDTWAVDYDSEAQTTGQAIEVNAVMDSLRELVEENVQVMHLVSPELAEILAHLTTSRCIYLIRFVGHHNPEFMESFGVLLENESDRSASVHALRRRLEAFTRARLLSDVFSTHRLERILKIMGSYSDV